MENILLQTNRVRDYSIILKQEQIQVRIEIPYFNVGAFSPDGKRVITNNGLNIRITDIDTGSYRDFTGHTEVINSLEYSSNGRYFISSSGRSLSRSNDNTVRIWDSETGQEVMVITGNNGRTRSALFSPDGKYIISRDETMLNFWNAENGTLIRNISITGSSASIAYSPDGSKIAVASGNRIIVLDAYNGREIYNLTGLSRGNVIGLCFNPEGNRLISASSENMLVWNMATGWGTEIKIPRGNYPYQRIALSLDGTTLIAETENRIFVLGMENK